jgi:hypothetical protein
VYISQGNDSPRERRYIKEDTSGGARRKLVRGCDTEVRVAKTTENPEAEIVGNTAMKELEGN